MRDDIIYQEKAVERLVYESKIFIIMKPGDKIHHLVLQAITGSGKTVIYLKYIEAMSPDSEHGIDDNLALFGFQ